ncbi:hypothetical protein PIB30_070154 [Stylosanthes scabra]|uniref:Uncharacterized protein n=1 Tax=Stylosanthes scabra TaxID=79078 RepID=A0ABU6QQK9_9FABA|nr:hypothetical protein [Stylosanthes scabra]
MPFELYETLDLGLLNKSDEVFTMVDTSIVAVAGIAENVLVKIGELTILAASFRLNYIDKIFTFEVGNVIEIFHPTRPPAPRKKGAHQMQVSNQVKKKKKEPVKPVKKKKKHEEDESS